MQVNNVSSTNFGNAKTQGLKRIEGVLKDGQIGRLDFGSDMYQAAIYKPNGEITALKGERTPNLAITTVLKVIEHLDEKAQETSYFLNQFREKFFKP